MDRGWIISGIVLACLLSGCAPTGSHSPAATSPSAKHTERYADLPGLRSSTHAGLKAELALLIDEQMTPAALDARRIAAHLPAASGPSAGRQALEESIPAISRPLLKAQLDEVYVRGPLRLSPIQLERGREILRRSADDRARFQQALQSAEAGLDLRLTDGILADVRFLDATSLGCRLEAIAAAEAPAENQPEDALGPLATILRAARLLAEQWSVTTRVTAANLRADALHVLGAIANHDRATFETHQRLHELLARETANWPPDAAAWVGDRAAGLVAYELVRDGYYLSLLDQSEMKQLDENGLLAVTAKAVMRNIDGDELFYLQAMRQMIERCQRPYFERSAALEAIRRDLASREQSGDYPLLAGRLLLADFETAHRRQAEDLARCSAWQLALESATGRDSNRIAANPLTGQPLTVQVTAYAVQVSGLSLPPDEPLTLRLRPVPQQARVPTRID